jgi:ParB-like chromosome segregation protein Spo0J
MKVERWALARVIPYDKNPRKNEGAVTNVMASIKEFGWRQPIVVDKDNVIIVGHTRWKAAQKLGLTHVPVHRATDLTKEQVKAYRLMDNRSNEDAEWDLEWLGLEMKDLEDAGFALANTGFNDAELNQILARGNVGLTDPDEAPPLPADPVSALGDVWVMGKHRLICGRRAAASHGDRPAVRRELRPGLAREGQREGWQGVRRHGDRQGAE